MDDYVARVVAEVSAEYAKQVCMECVQDPGLREMFAHVPKYRCMVCGRTDRPAIALMELFKLIRDQVEHHYEIDPGLYSGYSGMTLSQVVADMLQCSAPAVCDHIASKLIVPEPEDPNEEAFFAENNEYRHIRYPFESEDDERYSVAAEWNHLANRLKHEQRFFNRDAEDFFKELFDEMIATERKVLVGDPSAVVREFQAGRTFFRARLADSPRVLKEILADPESQMGAPPHESAKNNRMNPAGISLFYAATDKDTAIAEVRPAIGDDVVVAGFKTTKTLKLLDFTGLVLPLQFARISPFQERAIRRKERQMFLRYLHDEIAKPVRDEGSSYIVTQAMAGYLSHRYHVKFDGIIYKSVQSKGGINILLFPVPEDRTYSIAWNWRPRFPVELVIAPQVYPVKSVQYGFR